MLSSIHPLGERVRHNRWGLTVAAFVVAATAGGATVGATAGLAGLVLQPLPGRAVGGLALVATLVALVADLRPNRVRLPHWHRQVNEDWLDAYRGWVYGAGFGAQLGAGFLTIVTTAAVHLTFALALLTRAPLPGALIGVMFGLVRGLTLLAGARTRTAGDLRRLHQRLERVGPAAGRAVVAGMGVLCIAASVVLVSGAGS